MLSVRSFWYIADSDCACKEIDTSISSIIKSSLIAFMYSVSDIPKPEILLKNSLFASFLFLNFSKKLPSSSCSIKKLSKSLSLLSSMFFSEISIFWNLASLSRILLSIISSMLSVLNWIISIIPGADEGFCILHC